MSGCVPPAALAPTCSATSPGSPPSLGDSSSTPGTRWRRARSHGGGPGSGSSDACTAWTGTNTQPSASNSAAGAATTPENSFSETGMISSTVPVLPTGWRHRHVKTTGINILSGSRTFYDDNLWVTMVTLGVFPKVKSWFVQPESKNNICISEQKRSCTRTPDSAERLPSQNADADQSGGCARSSGGK